MLSSMYCSGTKLPVAAYTYRLRGNRRPNEKSSIRQARNLVYPECTADLLRSL